VAIGNNHSGRDLRRLEYVDRRGRGSNPKGSRGLEVCDGERRLEQEIVGRGFISRLSESFRGSLPLGRVTRYDSIWAHGSHGTESKSLRWQVCGLLLAIGWKQAAEGC